ncbi:hypothetical protein N4G69_15585 [Streptomyces mirabilis]|uniref:hypothetical protein n=1 Tax=Streptomyces mirabilis TaxID=68239 RepID=UPI0021C1E780|nr:hypothetical protein [Streptomyces mirabilis]MCT9107039.1 hypothetical protein [Streptomyces mirabilis]
MGSGKVLAGATVKIVVAGPRGSPSRPAASYTVVIDARGHYRLWLNSDFDPAMDATGYRAGSRTVRLHGGSRAESGSALTGT